MVTHLVLIREADPVEEQPEVEMIGWVVCEKNVDGGSSTLHFVGEVPGITRLRVTTAIKHLDWEKREGITSSGRRYRLVGPPAEAPDALLALSPMHVGLVDVTQLLLNRN